MPDVQEGLRARIAGGKRGRGNDHPHLHGNHSRRWFVCGADFGWSLMITAQRIAREIIRAQDKAYGYDHRSLRDLKICDVPLVVKR